MPRLPTASSGLLEPGPLPTSNNAIPFHGEWALVLRLDGDANDGHNVQNFAEACLLLSMRNRGAIAKFTGRYCFLKFAHAPDLLFPDNFQRVLSMSAGVLIPIRGDFRVEALQKIDSRMAGLFSLLGPLDMVGHAMNVAFRILHVCQPGTLALVEDSSERLLRIHKALALGRRSWLPSSVVSLSFLKGLKGVPIHALLLRSTPVTGSEEIFREQGSRRSHPEKAALHVAIDVVSSVRKSQMVYPSGATLGQHVLVRMLSIYADSWNSTTRPAQILRCSGDQIQLVFHGSGNEEAAIQLLKQYSKELGHSCRYLLQGLSEISYLTRQLEGKRHASVGAATHMGDMRALELSQTDEILGTASPGTLLVSSHVYDMEPVKRRLPEDMCGPIRLPRRIETLDRTWHFCPIRSLERNGAPC